ncbi:MAG: SBBP repeat-containing protein [Bacteroidetes bacterium]|nr:SBBP repeat-containing protein [Bacteroidota bacterium]
MKKSIFGNVLILLICSNVILFAGDGKISLEQQRQIEHSLQSRSVQFIENKGQITDLDGKPVSFVLFKVETQGINLFITEKGLTYTFFQMEDEHEKEEYGMFAPSVLGNEGYKVKLQWSRVDMDLVGANIRKENIIPEGKSPWFNQYYLGCCPNGISDVHGYSKIAIKDVYPGIDWVFYNFNSTLTRIGGADGERPKGFKYDFIVHPNANPNQIKLLYRSKNKLQIDNTGKLHIKNLYGSITENAPVSYIKENNKAVTTQFIKTKVNVFKPGGSSEGYETQVEFKIAHNTFNPKYETLVIDPQLIWATLYGGAGTDGPRSIDCDASGNIFITGYNQSGNFPILDPATGAYFQGVAAGVPSNIFILKFTNNYVLAWATYYGGSGGDNYPHFICVDPFGNIVVTGRTTTIDFPLFDPGNGAYFQAYGGTGDAFILKFNNAGVRQWATYYGGNANDNGASICTDNIGNIYLTGNTASPAGSFPVLLPFQVGYGGNNDAFILKFNNAGIRQWATFYGGSGIDIGNTICADAFGNIFIGGYATSANFPVQNTGTYFDGVLGGTQDAFILKFNNAGVRQWATYYGGSKDETFLTQDNIVVDICNNVYVSFNTFSSNIAVNFFCFSDYYDNTYNGGGSAGGDIFIIKFTNSGVSLWATYFGGVGDDFREALTISKGKNLLITGEWDSFSGPIVSRYLSYPLTDRGNGAYYNATTAGSDEGYLAEFKPVSAYTQSQVNNSSCTPCMGRATINVTCGQPSYSYIWSNGSTANTTSTTNTVTGLCGGTYTVTVYMNCDTIQAIYSIIENPGGISASITANNTCSSLGSATVTPAGGTGSYTYLWSNGQTAQTATNLVPGKYGVTVTDAAGCSDTNSVIIQTPFFAEYTKGTANCAGCGCKEWIMINAAGGTSPYSYTWPDGYLNRYRNQLCPGAYLINVKDKNGCSININLTTP